MRNLIFIFMFNVLVVLPSMGGPVEELQKAPSLSQILSQVDFGNNELPLGISALVQKKLKEEFDGLDEVAVYIQKPITMDGATNLYIFGRFHGMKALHRIAFVRIPSVARDATMEEFARTAAREALTTQFGFSAKPCDKALSTPRRELIKS